MKRTKTAFLAILFAASPLFAQTAAITNYCLLGAKQAITSGLDSTNYLQGVIPSCTVTVYLTGTTTLATIYADKSSTALTNPFTADVDGSWLIFAAVNQGYDVVLSGGISPNVYPSPVTLTDVFAGSDITVTGGISGSGTTGYIPVFTGTNSLGNSVIDQGVTTSGEVTLPWNITPRAVGYHAAFSNTTGTAWTANGYEAGYSNVCGSGWTFFGYQAGYNNNSCGSTPGVPNQAIGNTAIGYQAGYSNTSSLNWLAIGYQAGYSSTHGDWLAIGEKAGYASTSGTAWTSVGIEAGENNTSGNSWTALGGSARFYRTTPARPRYWPRPSA